ncbi:esterase-like activity of phytase family protein [Streptomyces sp. NPDC006184]|uniref:esterase-like activity of phytase family protein n=1 Tax=Streptomyces sp. NPDC006184 TaxID=3155455 RepID=UPI0033A47DF0
MHGDRDAPENRTRRSHRRPGGGHLPHRGTGRRRRPCRYLDRLPVPPSPRTAPAGRPTANRTFEALTLPPGGRPLPAPRSPRSRATPRPRPLPDPAAHRGRPLPARRPVRLPHRRRSRRSLGPGRPDGRLLVLERGSAAGVGNTVRLYLADPRHATGTSGIENPTGQDRVRPVRKALLADIAAWPSLGGTARQPQPDPLLDTIEGMTVAGRDRTGRLRVLLVSDDIQNAARTTRLCCLWVRTP